MPPDGLPDKQVLDLLDRQLGRYQAIIGRLAGNSVQVKTWCLAATAAISALAINASQRALLIVGAVLATIFWLLDAYYLTLERHFRRASDQLAGQVAGGGALELKKLLRIEPTEGTTGRQVLRCGASAAVLPFYCGVGLLLVVAFLVTI